MYSLPFITPRKDYIIEILRSYDMVGQLREFTASYGINLTMIFIVISFLFLLKDIFSGKYKFNINRYLLLIIYIASFVFGVTGIYTSIAYSPYSQASLIWLFQYFFIFIIPFLFLHFLSKSKNNLSIVYITITMSLLLQIIIGLAQFNKQSALGLTIEGKQGGAFYTGLDENNAFYRISGTLMYHNQLALISLTYLSISIIYYFRKKNLNILVINILGLILIVLTQSRMIWIASLIIFWRLSNQYRREINIIFKNFGLSILNKILIMIVFVLLFFIIIMPRISLSLNSFYEGAGIPIRLKMINEGMEAFIQNPWLGYGSGTNVPVLYSFFPDGAMTEFTANVHNGYLQLILEVGIIGFLCIIIPFIVVGYLSIKRNLISYISIDAKNILLNGLTIFTIYYAFQPHAGIIEFSYLGLILGFGLITLSNNKYNENT